MLIRTGIYRNIENNIHCRVKDVPMNTETGQDLIYYKIIEGSKMGTGFVTPVDDFGNVYEWVEWGRDF
jgi:hypothetical protein